MVWWRIAIGAVGMTLIWRPWRIRWSLESLAVTFAFGLALAGMNLLFYEAIARIPLGATVSLEFLGPVAVAVVRGRGAPPRIAAGIALIGVMLIGGWGLDLADPTVKSGFLFGLGAATAWALYILLGARIATTAPPGPSLAIGTLAASLVILPFLWTQIFGYQAPVGAGSISLPILALALIGVGLFSSAIPYSLEAVAFVRLPAATFALLTALLPATSTLVGAIALGQIPSAAELLGLVLISIAVWLAARTPAEVGSDRC